MPHNGRCSNGNLSNRSPRLPLLWAMLAVVSVADVASGQVRGRTDPMPEIPAGAVLEGDILRYPVGPRAAPRPDILWPNGVIPFAFATPPGTGGCAACPNATQQGQAVAAMQLWENVSALNFRPMQSGDTAWLLIQNSATGNNSFVGPQTIQPQVVNISNWNTQMILAHEFGHALGLEHEQSRPDRTTGGFVTINTANINSTCGTPPMTCANNFSIAPNATTWTPYDFDSTMHYGQNAFSNGGNTVTVFPAMNNVPVPFSAQPIGPGGQCFTNPPPAIGGWQAAGGMGQRTHLSHWDCRIVSFLYPYSNWFFLIPALADPFFGQQFGTFAFPWAQIGDPLAFAPIGATVWIDAGTYDVPSVLDRPITLAAPRGDVVLRSPVTESP